MENQKVLINKVVRRSAQRRFTFSHIGAVRNWHMPLPLFQIFRSEILKL